MNPKLTLTKVQESRKHFEAGVELLKKQNPHKAIPELLKAVTLDPSFEKARTVLEEAKESITWNSYYFCPNCGKFIEPNEAYPEVKISGICPRCQAKVPTWKELVINYAEISIKLLMFGILPILILIFCGMPYMQHNPPHGITIKWSPLPLGVITALTFTPIVFLFLLLINDPYGYSLGTISLMLNSINNPILYLLAAIIFLYLIMYIYFFLLLTPILALHKKGIWRKSEHQKRILLCTSLYTSLIILVRAISGVLY